MAGFAAEPVDHAPEARPFYFIVTFWGEQYRNYFLRFPLRSLLAPNNIPALKDLRGSKFLICTTPEDWHALQTEPLIHQLKIFTEPVFVESPSIAGEHKYYRMSRGHAAMTNICHEARARAIYLAVDTVVPDGCVPELERLSASGKRVVLCTAIRFEMEGVETDLAARGQVHRDQPLAVSRRDAVKIGLRNLHSESLCGNFEKSYFGNLNEAHGQNGIPICTYWEVPNETGIVIHTHNWAPFLIDYSVVPLHDTETLNGMAVDGDYIFRNFGDEGICREIHVVQDSDSIFLLGLTPKDDMVAPFKTEWLRRMPVLRDWINGFLINQLLHHRGLDPLRQKIYGIPVRWHARDLNDNWRLTESRANRTIQEYGSLSVDFRSLRSIRSRTDKSAGSTARRMLKLILCTVHTWKPPSPRRTLAETYRRLAAGDYRWIGAKLQELFFAKPYCWFLTKLYQLFFGKWPYLKRTHPRWSDLKHPLSVFEKRLVSRMVAAVFCSPGITPILLPIVSARSMRCIRLDPKRLGQVSGESERFDICVMELRTSELPNFHHLYQAVRPHIKPGGVLLAYFSKPYGERAPDRAAFLDVVHRLSSDDTATVSFAGSKLTEKSRRLVSYTYSWARGRGYGPKVVLVASVAIGTAAALLGNMQVDAGFGRSDAMFTSVTIEIGIGV